MVIFLKAIKSNFRHSSKGYAEGANVQFVPVLQILSGENLKYPYIQTNPQNLYNVTSNSDLFLNFLTFL